MQDLFSFSHMIAKTYPKEMNKVIPVPWLPQKCIQFLRHDTARATLQYNDQTSNCKISNNAVGEGFALQTPFEICLSAEEALEVFKLPFAYPQQLLVKIQACTLTNMQQLKIRTLEVVNAKQVFPLASANEMELPFICKDAYISEHDVMVVARYEPTGSDFCFNSRTNQFWYYGVASMQQIHSWPISIDYDLPDMLRHLKMDVEIRGFFSTSSSIIISATDLVLQGGSFEKNVVRLENRSIDTYCYHVPVRATIASHRARIEELQLTIGNAILSFSNGSNKNDYNKFSMCNIKLLGDKYASLLHMLQDMKTLPSMYIVQRACTQVLFKNVKCKLNTKTMLLELAGSFTNTRVSLQMHIKSRTGTISVQSSGKKILDRIVFEWESQFCAKLRTCSLYDVRIVCKQK